MLIIVALEPSRTRMQFDGVCFFLLLAVVMVRIMTYPSHFSRDDESKIADCDGGT